MARLNSPHARERHKQQLGCCFLCCAPLGEDESVEHLIPVSKGGANTWRNKVITHRKCNLVKSDRMPTETERNRFKKMTGHHPEWALGFVALYIARLDYEP